MSWVRVAVLTALTAPVVAFAHLATTGDLPPGPAVLGSALVALLLGVALARDPRRTGAGRSALLLGSAQLAGHALILGTGLLTGSGAGGCLPALGRGAGAGFALAARDTACPPGTIAVGPAGATAVAALLTALAILAGHVLLAWTGGLLLAAGEAAAAVVLAFLAVLGLRPPAAPVLLVAARRVRPARSPGRLRAVHLPVALTHRGPPALAG